MSVYAIRRKPRTVAHLAREAFGVSLCGRPVDMTSNLPGGRRICKDCARHESNEREQSNG